jgi:hypothetical protein
MMRVFRACPAPDGRLLGGSPWIDSGLLENQIPLQQRKKFHAAGFCEYPSRKHGLIQVFAMSWFAVTRN